MLATIKNIILSMHAYQFLLPSLIIEIVCEEKKQWIIQ